MALTKEFTEAVDNNKKIKVRIMLKDIMLVDPSLKSFGEMLKYAEQNMRNLYDQHDGEKLNNNSSEWNEDYMNQQMVSVVTNFSKERIELLGKIVEKLYDYKIQKETHTKLNRENGLSAARDVSKNGPTSLQVAGGIVAIAGTGTLVGGIIGSSASVAIVGGVMMAGGIAMIVLGGNKEA